MDIFENLENLEVSETCFNDIMGIVEEILSEDLPNYIIKKYGKPKYNSKGNPVNKSANLIQKASGVKREEEDEARWRRHHDNEERVKKEHPEIIKPSDTGDYIKDWANKSKYSAQIHNLALEKPNLREIRFLNKNKVGDRKTWNRRYKWEDDTEEIPIPGYRHKSFLGGGYHKGALKGYPHNQDPKSDEQRVQDSIARNKAKQEKKNK